MNKFSNHWLTSMAAGGTGIGIMDIIPTQQTFDLVLKAVVAIIAALPAVKQLFRKKKQSV